MRQGLDQEPLFHLVPVGVGALLLAYGGFVTALVLLPGRLPAGLVLLVAFAVAVLVPASVLCGATLGLAERPVAGLIRRQRVTIGLAFVVAFAALLTRMWWWARENNVDLAALGPVRALELLVSPDLSSTSARDLALQGAWVVSALLFLVVLCVARLRDRKWEREARARALIGRL